MNDVQNSEFVKRINVFLFRFPATVSPKVYARAIALVCLVNLFLIKDDIYELYGKNGLISSELSIGSTGKYTPTISNITELLSGIGFDDSQSLYFFVGIYVLSLLMVVLDYKMFLFSIIAYFGQVVITSSTYLTTHGGDSITTFILFLNVLLCLETIMSKDAFKALYSFTLRLAQIHLCIIYVFGGFGKLLGTDWFDGNAMWIVLNIYSPELAKDLSGHTWLFLASGLVVILLELLYPLLVYINRLVRAFTIVSVILMHVFIGVFMELQAFALIMILFNFIAWSNYYAGLPLLKRIERTESCSFKISSIFTKKHCIAR